MRRALVLAALASACGPSMKEIRTAKDSAYQIDFAIVWNVVADEVRKQYPWIVREDAVKGKIETGWRLVERTSTEELEQTEDTAETRTPVGQQQLVRSGKYFRLFVEITGGPPWRVTFDGEAAEYRPGLAQMQPFRHDSADEPKWVRGRIDAMYVRVHQRLSKYAVKREGETITVRKRVVDSTPWAALPADAAQAVAEVHAAAKRKDVPGVEKWMRDPFGVGGGVEQPLAAVVAIWNADPGLLADLVKTLEAGCTYDGGRQVVNCPVQAGAGPRAEFWLQGGQWRLAAFARD